MKPRIERTLPKEDHPLAAWFLGPKGEHSENWAGLLSYIFEDYVYWRRNYFPEDPIVVDRMRRREHQPWFDYMTANLDNILKDLKAHFPFYSPRYAAHMLSEQTLPAVLGYFAGMLYNPNNVTDEAAPVTVRLELEVGQMLSKMIGYNPEQSWAHICSGGTVANIEALWVARMVQFIPLILQEYCQKNGIDFPIKTANSPLQDIRSVSTITLLHLPTDNAISMVKNLARHLIFKIGYEQEATFNALNSHIHASAFNPAHKGLYSIYKKLEVEPRLYVSSSAHYSINKAANILGYGEENVIPIPVDKHFRMDVDILHEHLFNQKEDKYTAGVVAVMGSTEEGAIDPLHKVTQLRNQLEKEQNRSFWLHADAAWGGYIRSLFCGLETKAPLTSSSFLKEVSIQETVEVITHAEKNETINEEIAWRDPSVIDAFLNLNRADSVTIDPHKLGYIPYPAGFVAFKNGTVTDLLAQKAQYISDITDGISNLDAHPPIHAIGPYILEGSKPGAAAAACWLSHKTIPLELHGHGKIIRTSLLNAQKLYLYLKKHIHFFNLIEKEITAWDKDSRLASNFTFFPLFQPDSNIVCFIALPIQKEGNNSEIINKPLSWINSFNEKIYKNLTISGADVGFKPPYAQPYFVSRTRLEKEQYSFNALKDLLTGFNILQQAYEDQGLFVLRSTIMNPFYHLAEKEGKNYLLDFVKQIHLVTRQVMNDLYFQPKHPSTKYTL